MAAVSTVNDMLSGWSVTYHEDPALRFSPDGDGIQLPGSHGGFDVQRNHPQRRTVFRGRNAGIERRFSSGWSFSRGELRGSSDKALHGIAPPRTALSLATTNSS